MAQSKYDRFEVVSTNGTVTDITASVKNFEFHKPIEDVKRFIPYRFEAVLNLEHKRTLSVGDPIDFVGENNESYPYILKEIRGDGMYIFEPRKD